MEALQTDFGAFVAGRRVRIGPKSQGAQGAPGALDGLTFAVKDNVDVAGAVTGAGNPDWRAGRTAAERSASCVTALLRAGAALVGTTICDELAFSLEGRNAFDGTPLNPACPQALPGGSSSGSAVAVAAGLADVALGTDTGGSVRVPAAFCGIAGFRPTHGRVAVDGVVPLAPSYDTVGWFARSGAVLARAGAALLGEPVAAGMPAVRYLIATDAFAMIDDATRTPLLRAAARLDALPCAMFDDEPAGWRECYRVLQGAEIWAAHGDWITRARPRFAADIAARFADASRIKAAEVDTMRPVRARITAHLRAMVPPGTVLLLPTAPGPALARAASAAAIGAFYGSALALTAGSGHAGLPQVSLPLARDAGGCPLGLSVIGWHGGDTALLQLAAALLP